MIYNDGSDINKKEEMLWDSIGMNEDRLLVVGEVAFRLIDAIIRRIFLPKNHSFPSADDFRIIYKDYFAPIIHEAILENMNSPTQHDFSLDAYVKPIKSVETSKKELSDAVKELYQNFYEIIGLYSYELYKFNSSYRISINNRLMYRCIEIKKEIERLIRFIDRYEEWRILFDLDSAGVHHYSASPSLWDKDIYKDINERYYERIRGGMKKECNKVNSQNQTFNA